MTNTIEIKSLSKSYPDKSGRVIAALNNINLNIKQGEIFGIIGKSGAGKSSLLRCLNYLEKPSQGSISIDGKLLAELNQSQLAAIRQQMGMIFQHFNLLQTKTVFENIALPLRLQKRSETAIQQRVTELVQLVGIESKIQCYPSQLSGGEKQRVAIARALTTKPKVLLCDEATSALDPQTTQAILALLKEINLQLGITIVLITHEMEVIKQICHQVAVIHCGQIIEEKSVVSLFSTPETNEAKALIHNAQQHGLPDSLVTKLKPNSQAGHYPVIRMALTHHSASEPVVTELVNRFNLEINILQGNIEFIHDDTVGLLFVELKGDKAQVEAGIDYINSKNINVNIVGYVDEHTQLA